MAQFLQPLVVIVLGGLGVPGRGETVRAAHPVPAGLAHLPAAFGLLHQGLQCRGQRGLVAERGEQGIAAFHQHFRHAAHAGGDDRHAHIGRLQEHRARGFLVAGQGEDVEGGHQPAGPQPVAQQVHLAGNAQLGAQRGQAFHHRRAVAHDHQLQVRVLAAQRRDRAQQVGMALGLAQYGHATDHDLIVAEAQFAADLGAGVLQALPGVVAGGLRPLRRNRDRRHDADPVVGDAAMDQQLLDEAADGQHPVRQPGVGEQRIDRAHQVARSDHQRCTAQAGAGGGDQGIAAAGGIDHVIGVPTHQAGYRPDAAQHPQQAAHLQRMHGEAGLAGHFAQSRAGLAQQRHVVAAFAHGQHVAIDVDLLPAESLGGFRVQDLQWLVHRERSRCPVIQRHCGRGRVTAPVRAHGQRGRGRAGVLAVSGQTGRGD